MEELSTLRRRRGHIKASITNLINIIKNYEENPEEVDIEYLQASCENLEKTFERFEGIQEKLEEINPSEEEPKRLEYINSYNLTISRARKMMKRVKYTVPTSNDQIREPAHTSQVPNMSLPTLSLPKFNGAIEEWTSFIDVFTSLIHDDSRLTPVRKLHYLRLSLSGSAESLIASLETTGQNYEIAMSLLKKKYDHPRIIVIRHIMILREYPRLQNDSPKAISQLIETFHKHIRALEYLKAPTEHWDIPLLGDILAKIPDKLAHEWELSLQDNKIPSYNNLLDFLERHANCGRLSLTGTTTSSIHAGNKGDKKGYIHKQRQQVYATITGASCPICNDTHKIKDCTKFKGLNIEEKQKAVANASLCYNCLHKGHGVRTCKSSYCQICNRRHHTLLHKEYENETQAA